jgi:uncharacterized protein (TIGR02145 family)
VTDKVKDPIATAFISKQPISYYCYAYADGTSAPLDNKFAKIMEDSLVRALVRDKDSTGIAHLTASGNEYTAKLLNMSGAVSPDLQLKHFGNKDFSYKDCITEFTDERDGQKYKAVCIGKQNWMAENLRYSTPASMFYNDSSVLGSTYGRLYTWDDIMKGSASSNANPSGVQGICPKGWHVPSMKEWEQLIAVIGGQQKGGDLKATLNWNPPNTGATDKYGFKALGGGMFYPDSNTCYFLNQEGHFWTSTITSDPKSSHYALLAAYNGNIFLGGVTIGGNDRNKFSCRCVKD